jgi:hypothetical protein
MQFPSFNEVYPNRKVVFSKHARERLLTCGLTPPGAIQKLKSSLNQPGSLVPSVSKMRLNDEKGITFWQSDTVLFTVKEINDRDDNSPLILIITVTDKRVNLPSRFYL